MADGKNISPEIEAAIAEGREIGLREAAELLRSVRERRIHEMFRGIWRPVDDDGWQLMDADERRLLQTLANMITAKIGDAPVILDLSADEAERKRRDDAEMKEEIERNVAAYLRRGRA